MTKTTPKEHYLKDYQPPAFDIQSVYLEFELHPTETLVKSVMQCRRLCDVKKLLLSGESLELISVVLNGEEITQSCKVDKESLLLEVDALEFELVIVTRISPETNTALEGLYRSSGNYCTQCEAEGFRKITYFLDRPDILTRFTTKVIADKSHNPVLLSNGNLIESGDLDNNRHYAIWEDPFKKPCYLFALVAGDLECIEDHYRTADNRRVVLKIYVEKRNLDKCQHAMASLKKSMAWDEARFGLIYDLDIYMIVAVDDFNMGAMENKGLNVFNSKFVLAKPETATDTDYENIEAVIAHEYFHNWTGNRVTCRDWFQLTLKEGLTVFRDQEFTADMLVKSVKRIEDVKRLRSNQFPEDAGPMSHPIQPQSYIEMNNFYTMTVYEKGAEVIRLYDTLLGRDGFRKGMDLYFKRHDGQAVTVVDFRKAMEDANGVDLTQMHQWYIQSGTPALEVSTEYDAVLQTYQITFYQKNAGQHKTKPLLIPVKLALFSEAGEHMPLKVEGGEILNSKTECLLRCTQALETFTFTEVLSQPIPSFLRGFSAPIHLHYEYSDAALSLLARSDSDSFVRWESFQRLVMREIKQNIARYETSQSLVLSEALTRAFKGVLQSSSEETALTALMMTLPDLTYIGEQFSVINVDAIYHVHQWLKTALANKYEAELLSIYQTLNDADNKANNKIYRYHKTDIAARKLKKACLHYLILLSSGFELAKSQYYRDQNMTDVLAALEAISHTNHPERNECLEHFYNTWREETLVLDKWFMLQSASHHPQALEHVKALVNHVDFIYTNPNRVRSVLGVFGRLNLLGFHRADGQGYAFLADQVLKLDAINPQVAARIVAPFTHWKRYDSERRAKMKTALNTILQHTGLSKDVYEIVSKTIG